MRCVSKFNLLYCSPADSHEARHRKAHVQAPLPSSTGVSPNVLRLEKSSAVFRDRNTGSCISCFLYAPYPSQSYWLRCRRGGNLSRECSEVWNPLLSNEKHRLQRIFALAVVKQPFGRWDKNLVGQNVASTLVSKPEDAACHTTSPALLCSIRLALAQVALPYNKPDPVFPYLTIDSKDTVGKHNGWKYSRVSSPWWPQAMPSSRRAARVVTSSWQRLGRCGSQGLRRPIGTRQTTFRWSEPCPRWHMHAT